MGRNVGTQVLRALLVREVWGQAREFFLCETVLVKHLVQELIARRVLEHLIDRLDVLALLGEIVAKQHTEY